MTFVTTLGTQQTGGEEKAGEKGSGGGQKDRETERERQRGGFRIQREKRIFFLCRFLERRGEEVQDLKPLVFTSVV